MYAPQIKQPHTHLQGTPAEALVKFNTTANYTSVLSPWRYLGHDFIATAPLTSMGENAWLVDKMAPGSREVRPHIHATLTVENMAGLTTTVTSADVVMIDDSAPSKGTVKLGYRLTEEELEVLEDGTDALRTTSRILPEGEVWWYTSETKHLGIHWDDFNDGQSGLMYYEWSVEQVAAPGEAFALYDPEKEECFSKGVAVGAFGILSDAMCMQLNLPFCNTDKMSLFTIGCATGCCKTEFLQKAQDTKNAAEAAEAAAAAAKEKSPNTTNNSNSTVLAGNSSRRLTTRFAKQLRRMLSAPSNSSAKENVTSSNVNTTNSTTETADTVEQQLHCDATALTPKHGSLGTCSLASTLQSGSTCDYTCVTPYILSGSTRCKNGVLSPGVCNPPLKFKGRLSATASEVTAEVQ